jgi:hypothetical protein
LTFKDGYLTTRETQIWNLRKHIPNQSQIARTLGISRQAINLALISIEDKMERTFNETLNANNLTPVTMNLVDGVMEAYSPAYQLPVIVSLSNVNGLKVWYLYEGNCARCNLERSCRKTLLAEAEERNVLLSESERRIEPTKLALKVYSNYLKEEKILGK